MSIEPIRGKFEDWRALLGKVMEDDEIEHLVIVTFRKDEAFSVAHYECTRQEMAFASLVLAQTALEPS